MIDVKPIVDKIRRECNKNVRGHLVCYSVKPTEDTLVYYRQLEKMCDRIGFGIEKKFYADLDDDVYYDVFQDSINAYVTAQMVLDGEDRNELDVLIHLMKKDKDVERIIEGYSATAEAVIRIVDHLGGCDGLKVVVCGRSRTVGKPVADRLSSSDYNGTVTVIHSHTKQTDIDRFLSDADIIITAVGVPNWLQGGMIKKDAVVIDVGINVVDGGIVGDVSKDVENDTSFLTPVPKGVGSVTTAVMEYRLSNFYCK